MVRDDWTSCPSCKFTALYTEFQRFVVRACVRVCVCVCVCCVRVYIRVYHEY